MNPLAQVLSLVESEFEDEIWAKGSNYVLVDLGKAFKVTGIIDDIEQYTDVVIVVPLKRSTKGLAIAVSGREFSNYSQLDSGIAVPEWVAEKSGLDHKPYEPPENMTLYM